MARFGLYAPPDSRFHELPNLNLGELLCFEFRATWKPAQLRVLNRLTLDIELIPSVIATLGVLGNGLTSLPELFFSSFLSSCSLWRHSYAFLKFSNDFRESSSPQHGVTLEPLEIHGAALACLAARTTLAHSATAKHRLSSIGYVCQIGERRDLPRCLASSE